MLRRRPTTREERASNFPARRCTGALLGGGKSRVRALDQELHHRVEPAAADRSTSRSATLSQLPQAAKATDAKTVAMLDRTQRSVNIVQSWSSCTGRRLSDPAPFRRVSYDQARRLPPCRPARARCRRLRSCRVPSRSTQRPLAAKRPAGGADRQRCQRALERGLGLEDHRREGALLAHRPGRLRGQRRGSEAAFERRRAAAERLGPEAALGQYRRGAGFVSYLELKQQDTRKLAQLIDILAER